MEICSSSNVSILHPSISIASCFSLETTADPDDFDPRVGREEQDKIDGEKNGSKQVK